MFLLYIVNRLFKYAHFLIIQSAQVQWYAVTCCIAVIVVVQVMRLAHTQKNERMTTKALRFHRKDDTLNIMHDY